MKEDFNVRQAPLHNHYIGSSLALAWIVIALARYYHVIAIVTIRLACACWSEIEAHARDTLIQNVE